MRGLPRFRASKAPACENRQGLLGIQLWGRVLGLFGGILLSGVLGFHALQRTSFLCGLDVFMVKYILF